MRRVPVHIRLSLYSVSFFSSFSHRTIPRPGQRYWVDYNNTVVVRTNEFFPTFLRSYFFFFFFFIIFFCSLAKRLHGIKSRRKRTE